MCAKAFDMLHALPHRTPIRMPGSRWAVQFMAAIAVLLPWPVQAQDGNSGTTAPTRPSIMFNRWQEDWSVLADPRVPREPLDGLKYIPLSAYDFDDAPAVAGTALLISANLRAVGIDFVPDDARMKVVDAQKAVSAGSLGATAGHAQPASG
jgi:hypothetical protein